MNDLYPIMSQGVEYSEDECNDNFKAVYLKRGNLNQDGSLFLSKGFYIYPSGKIIRH